LHSKERTKLGQKLNALKSKLEINTQKKKNSKGN
jgi:hypothetical protein